MKAKYQGLGPIKCHELSVLICFIIVIVLWFMRKPLFMAGKFLIDLDLCISYIQRWVRQNGQSHEENLEEFISVWRNHMGLQEFHLEYSFTPGVGIFSKVWVAKVRASTHTCDVRSHVCVCVRNDLWNKCAKCVRAGLFSTGHTHTRATTHFPYFPRKTDGYFWFYLWTLVVNLSGEP